NFVARIVPIGVVQGRGLGDDVMGGWLLIGRCGTDKEELFDLAAKQFEAALDIRGLVRNPIYNHVKLDAAHCRPRLVRVMHIGGELHHSRRRSLAESTIEMKDLVPLGDGELCDRGADKARAPNKE